MTPSDDLLEEDGDEEFVMTSEELHSQAQGHRRGDTDSSDGDAGAQGRNGFRGEGQVRGRLGGMGGPNGGSVMDGANRRATSDGEGPPAVRIQAESLDLDSDGWPMRLVSVVSDAQPPRAILGFPDGREIVVSPGRLLPDDGLVVLSVTPHQVQLARIDAEGDHAVVSSTTLQSQY